MKVSTLIFLFSLISSSTFAQKSMTFKEATEIGIFQKLDSLYQGGIDSDSTKSLFKDQQAYMKA